MSLPFAASQKVWTDQEATATKALSSEFALCTAIVVEIITTGFSGTLDIQGKIAETATFDNVSYIQQGQDGAQSTVNDQLSYTTNTSRARYLIMEYWKLYQLVMTRTAGSISVDVVGIAGTPLASITVS